MKEKLREALAAFHEKQQSRTENMAQELFALDPSAEYDALVVAPGWMPWKILRDNPAFTQRVLSERNYISSHLVEREGVKIAWVQTASGGCNLIDHLTICAELRFRRLIFAGAVGGLVPEAPIGAVCTPSYSIAGTFANAYLCERLTDYRPFGRVDPPDGRYVEHVRGVAAELGMELRRAPVFCTDSISLEYLHLDEIRATGAQLIEMETSSFYLLADLIEVPAVALLAVSDNSAAGVPLIGRSREDSERYHRARSVLIPELIYRLARED